MFENSKLQRLVSDIVNENQNKHCRLCLELVEDEFLRFDDYVTSETNSTDFENLAEILKKFLGDEVYDVIPGLDLVCMKCVEKTLTAVNFIKQCQDSSQFLNNIFNYLTEALNVDSNELVTKEALYIVVDKDEPNVIFVEKKKAKHLLKCTACAEIFRDVKSLVNHNQTIHNQYTCTKCSVTSPSYDCILEHLASNDEFNCTDCRQFRCTETSLKKHQIEQHKDHICRECGKTIKGLFKLQSHQRKHTTTSKCPKCLKSYLTKEFYLRHIKLCLENRLDTQPMRSKLVKNHVCDKCGKGYSTAGGLKVHKRFIHGNAKFHVCPHCNKSFTAPSYLKTHMVTHSGEKNFPCEICERKFVSKEALLYHTRRHTGEKPYSCNLCDERFVNSSARAEHIKFKHVGPTLLCEICSQKFVTPSFLRLHMKKHHDPTNKLYVDWATLKNINQNKSVG